MSMCISLAPSNKGSKCSLFFKLLIQLNDLYLIIVPQIDL